MKAKKDNAGVYLPPPILYVAVFFLSILIQRYFPLPMGPIGSSLGSYLSVVFILIGIMFALPALIAFFKTKNTLITIKPATSLQTKGIYNISRNPMYVGLLSVYIGIALILGNWWTFLLIPLVIFVITRYVIIKEERYLERAFGQDYLNYKTKVRRWL